MKWNKTKTLTLWLASAALGGVAIGQTGAAITTIKVGIDGGDQNDFHYYGQSGGIAAYSMGTTSCNPGTEVVTWTSSNHPVIGQNFFRLKDGRFEQIGQSWLKHGFCAVNESGCGSCQGTSCNTLGLGCADTYWATLNDGAGGGPKYQVNATSGVHQHPYPSPSGPSTIRGRLQVQVSDIDPTLNTGAEYFAEAQYVSQHTAEDGNGGISNAWRKLNVVSVSNIDGGGITMVDQCAPYAWASEDSSVNVQDIMYVDEGGSSIHGHYTVGYKVEALGSSWRYTYVVYNRTSDSSAGSLSIPVGSSATLTNLYFNDVAYHSGEPFNSNDWLTSQAGGMLTWQTDETFSQNPNANAIRWGNMWSFGFDADVPPTPGTAELGMFKDSHVIQFGVAGPGGDPPPLFISFPEGIPELVNPSGNTTLSVHTAPGLDSAIPGSGILHVNVAGQPTQVPLTDTAPGEHEGNFPAVDCGSQLDWYVSFDLTGGGTYSSPAGAPADTYTSLAWVVNQIAADDLESDTGWTGGVPGDDATTGMWTRVDPIGTDIQPEDDHTPAPGSQCWVTGQGSNGGSNGENDVDNGSTTLLSPVYNMSGPIDPTLSYWRWYNNGSGSNPAPNADVFVIDISNDGGASWTNVETVGPSGAETNGGWIEHAFLVSDFVTPTAAVQLRFVASDLGSGSYVEAAIDDLQVTDFGCGCGASNYCISEPNSSGAAGVISASGSFDVGDNDLHLSVAGVASSQPGIFYYGQNQTQIPFGNGFRCIGGSVVRLPVVWSDGTGSSSYDPDLTNLPPGGQIDPGSTWNFQYWFRDPVAGGANFDFTDAIEIHFCP